MIGDSTQSAETAEAGCRWFEGGPCGPLSGFEIRGGCKRVNVSEIHIDTALPVVSICVHVCVSLSCYIVSAIILILIAKRGHFCEVGPGFQALREFG